MNKEKKNILFLSSLYPNRVLPTLGNFVQKHAESIALNSNVSALHVCSDLNCKEKFEITECIINNVFTVNVYYKKVTHTIPIISKCQKAFRFIYAHIKGVNIINTKSGKIDLVHHNILYPAGIIALYLKKIKQIPYIITENWTGYLPSKKNKFNYFQKTLSKIIARNASFITPVSRDLKNAMIQHKLISTYEIVYNVVDIKLFYPEVNKTAKRKIKLLHISTLDDAHKNISGMLRVTSELSKRIKDFEFWFIGDGDNTAHIEIAKSLGIYNTYAFFDGTKTTDEVSQIMRNSDCFILFSNYENLPCVLIEAMASGLPIVSSTVGGIAEHITNSFGILVKPRDEKALLESLMNVINNIKSGKYSAEEISNYAKNMFSYEKVSEQFHELYQRILNTQN